MSNMSTVNDIYIIGAGGFGREVAWLIERINSVKQTWNIKGFIDDNNELIGTACGAYKVLGTSDYLKGLDKPYVVCAIGSSKIRRLIIEKVNDFVKFATVIDPSVLIGGSCSVGEGTIICAGTIVTVDATIGNHVIINLDCTVGHDAVLHDFVTLYPSVNVSGFCNLEECVELGTGTQIIQGLCVGKESIVGAGAVVVKNLPEKCTAVGSPAKPIKFHE